jgi:hypothetical protein
LAAFARRRLEEPFAYLILDARYEKVREAGVVHSQAVLLAVGIDWDGRRQILAVELANRESRSSWKDFLLSLRERGLHGLELVVADDHAGLRAAIREVLPEAAFQRCYVHTIRTQSPVRLVGRPVPAWRRAAQGNDMPDLQAAVADDDALDDELQDCLLAGERRRFQAPADPGAERFQAGAGRLRLEALTA